MYSIFLVDRGKMHLFTIIRSAGTKCDTIKGHLKLMNKGVNLVDGVSHGVAASLEASRHLVAPDAESERDEEGGDEDHDAHQAAHEHVDESREKAENKRKN